MNKDRDRPAWRGRLFDAALALPPDERAAFLDGACAGDPELRRELDVLLSAASRPPKIRIPPRAGAASGVAETADRAHLVGWTLGPYQIEELIGRGNMGEVYLAHDVRLDRRVALKLLPAQFTSDAVRTSRFEEEARAASALNHPGILTIYDVGDLDGVRFMATEFVAGETLRQRVMRGPLPSGDVLDIGIQIAEALAAAHASNIVHRDIKPENVMVRPDGLMKILDFGIAKLSEYAADSNTRPGRAHETRPGDVVGTVAYMAPEQALGEAVDSRVDIFALGVVLYELLTGEPPFKAQTDAGTFDAILHKAPPPMAASADELSRSIDRVVRRALEKDRGLRYQSAADLLGDLRRLRRDSIQDASRSLTPATAEPRPPRANARRLAAVVALAGVVAVGGWYLGTRLGSDPALRAPVLGTVVQLTRWEGPEFYPNLSPDGSAFVYARRAGSSWDIYFQRVGGSNPINLTSDSPADDVQPALSPDGQSIVFRSERDGGGLFVMGATGESVRRLTAEGHYPAWSPDSREVIYGTDTFREPSARFMVPSQLWAVNVPTGERRLITGGDAVQPAVSPNGRWIAYWGLLQPSAQRDLGIVDARGGTASALTGDAAVDWNPVWSPDGRFLYFLSDRGGSMNVWRMMIDGETGARLGDPQPVTTPSAQTRHLAFSRDGRYMAYVGAAGRKNVRRLSLDANLNVVGEPVSITRGARITTNPAVSADGRWLAFDSVGDQQEDLFVAASDGSGERRLTDDVFRDRVARWAPDGERIAFFSDRSGRFEIWSINPDGSGLRQLTDTTGPHAQTPVWSPDGRRIAYSRTVAPVALIEMDDAGRPRPLESLKPYSQPETFFAYSWSPDGRMLAGHGGFARPNSGIIVYSFDSASYEVLTDSGSRPTWLTDNRRLLYMDGERLMVVDRVTKQIRTVVDFAPEAFENYGLSSDASQIYVAITSEDADIWMALLQ